MQDKSVSTEHFDPANLPNYTETIRLETILNILVENKILSVRNNKHGQSRRLIPSYYMKPTSLSPTSVPSSEVYSDNYSSPRNERRNHERTAHDTCSGQCDSGRCSNNENRSLESAIPCEEEVTFVDENTILPDDPIGDECNCVEEDSISEPSNLIFENKYPCQCYGLTNAKRGHLKDRVILKIDSCDNIDSKHSRSNDRLHRIKRKRHKNRKKRAARLAARSMPYPVHEPVTVLDNEDLSQRARWTIAATACLLLSMCLLLVGVTLRMAPIIDDMIRRENMELMNSSYDEPLNRNSLDENSFLLK